MPWYRDRRAWRFIGLRYLPWLAALSLLWELAQLPLYTIWRAPLPQRAFAVAHCTVGDVLIGAAALLIAVLVTHATTIADWKRVCVVAIAIIVGMAYTLFSEWLNTSVRGSWEYSPLMPVVELGALRVGLSPLAQWIIVPTLALKLAFARSSL